MTDSITQEHRSWNMSRIRSTDTSVEIKVRKYLFANGYRFRKNVKELPGKPDVVLPKYRTAIFIHGCFWHRHQNCKRATMPKSRVDYWTEKFAKNIENDCRNISQLVELGWNVITVWECEINKAFEDTMERLVLEIDAGVTKPVAKYIKQTRKR